MTFGIGIIVKRAFLGSETFELGNHRIEVSGGFGLFPFIIITHAEIGSEARIEPIFPIEVLQDKHGFMIFSALEILKRHPQSLTV